MSPKPSRNSSLMKHYEWFTVAGSMSPAQQQRMHVRQTLFWSAELQEHHEQTPEYDLRHVHTVQIDIHIDASLCTSSDRQRGSQCRRSRIKPVTCTAKHPRSSVHHTLQTIDSILTHSGEKAVTIINPADYNTKQFTIVSVLFQYILTRIISLPMTMSNI